jgi:type IV pilus assembly protein PilW
MIAALKNRKGFTLTELMVVMAISGVVMAGIYSAYYSQQRSFMIQEQVVAMQQNLRSGMYFMVREIRMAGYDPTGKAGAGIISATADSIRFAKDDNGNGDTNDSNEDITYSLYDFGKNGVNDLGRDTGEGNQPVAENIDALNFVYFDEHGAVLDTPVADPEDIRFVQISLVARTGRGDPEYTNNNVYTNQLGTVIYKAPGDNFRRKLLTAQIKCRNLGLD